MTEYSGRKSNSLKSQELICDCQNPEPISGVAYVSEECPIHNVVPYVYSEALSREGGELDEAAAIREFEEYADGDFDLSVGPTGQLLSMETYYTRGGWLARAEYDHAAITEARKRIAELETGLIIARDTFDHYGDLHAAKPDPVKASRNYELAKQMGALITPTTGEGM